MIVRINKTKDYSVISNYHLKDKNLSLKAKGLLSMMLSLPDDWEYSIDGLVAISKENETAIRNALDELKDNKYLIVNKLLPNQTQSGRYEYQYDIFELPQDSEKQGVENIGLVLGNIKDINNNKQNTKDKILNNKENILKEMFDRFWANYPKKIDKQGSYKAFKNIPNIENLLDKILKDINHKKQFQWGNVKYIPHPTTYLHQHRWEDEVEGQIDDVDEWYKHYWDDDKPQPKIETDQEIEEWYLKEFGQKVKVVNGRIVDE